MSDNKKYMIIEKLKNIKIYQLLICLVILIPFGNRYIIKSKNGENNRDFTNNVVFGFFNLDKNKFRR